jgi:uncharacterized Zn-finger protein
MVRKTKLKGNPTPKTRNDLMIQKKTREKNSKPLSVVVKRQKGKNFVKPIDENKECSNTTKVSRKPKTRLDTMQQNKEDKNSKSSGNVAFKQQKGNSHFKTTDENEEHSKSNTNITMKPEKAIDDFTGPYICEICPAILKNAKTFKEHQRIHRRKTHKCRECGKLFMYESILREHFLMHTGETPHQCPHCPKKFRTKSNLKKHLITHGIHSEKRSLYNCQCDICGKMLRFASNLHAHKKSHEEERPFMCVECGKQFKTKAHLDIHMACHLKIEPYECETCGKKFRDKSNLRKHQLIHTGDRHFKCDICDWTFLRKDQLKMHQRTHTKVVFQCTVCEKQFKTEAYYKMHLSQHTYGNNYLCDVCNKFYSSNSNLKMHMKTCHGASKSVSVKAEKGRKIRTVKKEIGDQSKMEVITVIVLKETKNDIPLSPSNQEKMNEPEISSEKPDLQYENNSKENNSVPHNPKVSTEESVGPKQCILQNEEIKDENSKIAYDNPATPEQGNTVPPDMKGKPDISIMSTGTEQKYAEPSSVTEQKEAEPSSVTEQKEVEPSSDTDQMEAKPSSVTEQKEAEPSSDTEQKEAEPSSDTEQKEAEPSSDTEQEEAEPSSDTEQEEAEPSSDTEQLKAEPSSDTEQEEAESSSHTEQEEAEPEGKHDNIEGASEALLNKTSNVTEETKGRPGIETNIHEAKMQTELVQNEENLTAVHIEGGVKYIQIYTNGQLHTLTGVRLSSKENS